MKQTHLYRAVRLLKLAFVSRKIPKFIFLFILTGFFVVPVRSLGSKQFTSSISKNKLLFYEKTIFKGAYLPKKRQQITIKGKVLAEDKQPIIGANVMIKGRSQRTKTDKNGEFRLMTNEIELQLVISFVGYQTSELSIKDKEAVQIIYMKPMNNAIEEVVVTGMFERKKESFTGSSTTISGDQLRTVGTQNVVQLLKSLDPSFVVVDNNLAGSNPNMLANIEFRGKTSIPQQSGGVFTDQFAINPNLPLFILDGFESTLRQITDLDINRIASVTLLKDAASAALYGARSANGVVVVETIKPKPGELRINYSGSFAVSLPDLGDYNMMNAKEKLEFEKLAGRYAGNQSGKSDYFMLEQMYNRRLAAVQQGVDTYWLNEPLRAVGLDQNHSLYVSGGTNEFMYEVGGNYQPIYGLMKGSGRKNWGARSNLVYRKNKLNISNSTFISGTRADESIYGSFATYVGINPYYKRTQTARYLEQIPDGIYGDQLKEIPNPLYDAQLNSEQFETSLQIQNNFGFNYDINKALRLSGAFQLTKSVNSAVNFISPLNSAFIGTAILEKGSYDLNRGEAFEYSGNLAVRYFRKIKEKHVLTSNFRSEILENSSNFSGFTVVGFPLGVAGNPSFAYSYKPDAKPEVYTPPKTRRINATASVNYVYADRYFVDASYRLDGSTAFGTANKYSPFWSVGIGWNLRNEKLIKNLDWINGLILRANIGSTGNQGFGSFASVTTYNLDANTNYFGQGLYHSNLGNPSLKWQKTLNKNLQADVRLFHDRLTFVVDVYNKSTDPLIITLDVPGSNGISGYPMNIGSLTTKGIEANIKYSPIFKIEQRIIWTLGVMGSKVNSKYGGFGNLLNNLNEEQLRSKSIQRYADGRSPDDLWAVPSLGIDPSSGREVFVKANGSYTFDYDPADIRKVAHANPTILGVISSSLRIKNFTFDALIRYNFGLSRFNESLYNKVENLSLGDLDFNQDRRAFELRWKQPGDMAQFKGISLTEDTPMSSRFIQKENIITGESISLGYEFQSSTSTWLKSMRLRNLRISGFMNNIFRISNIVNERGTNYPFANTVSFSINASF